MAVGRGKSQYQGLSFCFLEVGSCCIHQADLELASVDPSASACQVDEITHVCCCARLVREVLEYYRDKEF